MTVFENVAFGLRVRPRAQRLPEAEIAKKVHEAARAGAARLAGRPLPAPALGRPAAAHRAGARARRRAARAAARRAVRRARCASAQGAAAVAAPAARRDARHQRLRHARPGGSARGRRPRRRDEPRPHRAGRHARRGLRPSGDAVRRSSSSATSTACRCRASRTLPASRARTRSRCSARPEAGAWPARLLHGATIGPVARLEFALEHDARTVNVELARDAGARLALPRGAVAYLRPTHLRRYAGI